MPRNGASRRWSTASPGAALGEMGALLPSVPGGLWRARRDLRLRCRCARRHREHGAGGDDRRLRAQRHRRPLHPQLRLRGAEEALAAEDGVRRDGRRHRHDRARHRLGPAKRQDHREEAGQFLRHQRPEDVHHQRTGRRSRHRGRAHRRAGRQRPLADRGRDRGRRRLSARAQPRQDRAARLRYVRTVLRQCRGAAGKPARQRGRPGLCPADAAIAAGAPRRSRSARSPRWSARSS